MSQSKNTVNEKRWKKLEIGKSEQPESDWYRHLVECLYEMMLEMKFTNQLDADHYERTENARDIAMATERID